MTSHPSQERSPNARDFQERIERHTMDLLRTQEVQAAKLSGEQALLASIPDADASSIERFAEIAEEIALNALIGFADGYTGQDLPRLIMRAPHQLGPSQIGPHPTEGHRVPGNRGLHDNPDTFYRLVPLDGRSDFLLVGKVSEAPASVFELSALTSEWQTLANLTRDDLGIAPGSEFRIRFSPHTPAEGPSDTPIDAGIDHHVHISPDAEMLLVRETLADWETERPSLLTIENHADRGGERELDPADFISGAAARVAKWFRESVRLTKLPLSQPANFFPTPVISGEHGKLVTMAYSIGHFWVRPGEALVLIIDPGPADYVGVPITNIWGTTNRNLDSTASWNNRQALANADGTFTCVLSLEDPGVHNWLDPDGLERGFIFMRWANLDATQRPAGPPGITSEIVSVKALSDVLPEETRWITPTERAALAKRREAEHALRFAARPSA